MNRGGMNVFASSRRASDVDSSIRAGDLTEGRNVILRVAFGGERMTDGERLDETNVRAVHLFERKRVVEERLLSDSHIELPVHDISGKPLRIRQAGAVEPPKRGEPLLCPANAVASPFERARRHLPLETILFSS